MSASAREKLDTKSKEYLEGACNCSTCVQGVTAWYRLAIMLNPDNPIPYIRLAQEIFWELDEWPGDTLRLLRYGDHDEATLKRVMGQYQKEDSELVKQIQEAVCSL